MAEKDGTLIMENARMIFRNFAGKEGMYNREGDRNFCVLLEDDLAEKMAKDGWNIKTLKAREEGDNPQPYLQISVGYKGRPPQIVMITSRNRTFLGEDEVEMLDWADIRNVDLIVRPYHWVVREGTEQEASGVKAYLKSLYVTIEEDELELKYAELDDLPSRGGKTDD